MHLCGPDIKFDSFPCWRELSPAGLFQRIVAWRGAGIDDHRTVLSAHGRWKIRLLSPCQRIKRIALRVDH